MSLSLNRIAPTIRFGRLTPEQRAAYLKLKDSFVLFEDVERGKRRAALAIKGPYKLLRSLMALSLMPKKNAQAIEDTEWALIRHLNAYPVLDPIIMERFADLQMTARVGDPIRNRILTLQTDNLYTRGVRDMILMIETDMNFTPSDALWAALMKAIERCKEPRIISSTVIHEEDE